MKAIHWIIAAAALASFQPAQAGINDPEIIIYRFPGVKDDGGGANVGIATVFLCTNFSGVSENIRFAARSDGGALLTNGFHTTGHLVTVTMFTHLNAAYTGITTPTGAVNSGTMAIAATSINVICTAMTIDAANTKPVGIALRGIRFNPVPGSQE